MGCGVKNPPFIYWSTLCFKQFGVFMVVFMALDGSLGLLWREFTYLSKMVLLENWQGYQNINEAEYLKNTQWFVFIPLNLTCTKSLDHKNSYDTSRRWMLWRNSVCLCINQGMEFFLCFIVGISRQPWELSG